MSPESKTNGLIIAEWVTLVTIILGSLAYMHSDSQRMSTMIHERTLAQEVRTDALYEQFQLQIQCQNERTDNLYQAQGARTDKLYEMFIDLIKEKK